MPAKTPAARLSTLDNDALRRLCELWRRASELASDNPRSLYHRWYYRVYFEIEKRKDNPR